MTTNSELKVRLPIGVIGPSKSNFPTSSTLANEMIVQAKNVGVLLAASGAIVFTGGQDGVMEAVCEGVKSAGGITVGTPGRKRLSCNRFVDIEVCTPIDVGDYLFAGLLSCDAIVVFPGGAGTMAELALAYRMTIPMVIFRGFSGWYDKLIGNKLDTSSKKESFFGASSAKECVDLTIKLARKRIANITSI